MKIQSKKTKKLVNTEPTIDDAGTDSPSKSSLKRTNRPYTETHEEHGRSVLLEMARAYVRQGKYVISSQTPNAALGQLAKRKDAVGAAARAERDRRQKAAQQKPKISHAMELFKKQLKGEKLSASEIKKMAAVKAAPRTMKATMMKAARELEHEEKMSAFAAQIAKQARKNERERQARRAARAAAETAAKEKMTKAKKTLKPDMVVQQVLQQTKKQSKLPDWFDPHHHYVGKDRQIYFWKDLDQNTGNKRPLRNQVRALSPRTDIPVVGDVKPKDPGLIKKLLGGGQGPSVNDSNAKVSRAAPHAVVNPAPEGPIAAPPAPPPPPPPTEKELRAQQHRREDLNKERTIEYRKLEWQYRTKGFFGSGPPKIPQMELYHWEKKWEKYGFQFDDLLDPRIESVLDAQKFGV